MNTQSQQIASRLAESRRIRDENEALRRENAKLRDSMASLQAHLDLAAVMLAELRDDALERLVLVDGWNLILGADRVADSRDGLLARYRDYLDAHPGERVWIVFDGPAEAVANHGRMRISYTGGTGEQRADRFIAAFVRTAKFLSLDGKIRVDTFDKRLAAGLAKGNF